MRILSGVKSSGRPHLGNYFGAIRQFIDLQAKGEGFYFVADLHALDKVRDAERMRDYTLGVALDFLALGLDPERCTLYVQSEVPEVSQLQWILGTVAPYGQMLRSHAFKSAQEKGAEIDMGLFCYPLLMAADILLVRSNVVPVGKDQKQHLELTRDIAVKFNMTYCPDFDPATGEGGALVLPEPLILEDVAVVPGTDGEKMGKSDGNTIELFAPDKQVKKQIMRIVTDSTPVEAPKDPDRCHVYAILKLFGDEENLTKVRERYTAGGTGYGEFKTMLLEKFHARFDEARTRRAELEGNLDYVRAVLDRGSARARAIGGEVLASVQKACGVR
jgi:tryptophanyl-tRNA synthetase